MSLQLSPGLDLKLTAADVERVIEPYVHTRFDPDHLEWRLIVKKTRMKYHRRLKRRLSGEFARTQAAVDSTYTDVWSSGMEGLLLARKKPVPFEWGDRGMLLKPQARRRLNHFLLRRALAAVAPSRILEVGMGNGFNLFLLAAQQPRLRLTGLELTESGVQAARAAAHAPSLPAVISKGSTASIVDRTAHRRVGLVQGTAAALPFPDGAFDTVCTVLALEQMEEIRDRALAEIRRVTSRWAIMIEPFRDLNDAGIRFDYVRSQDYLSETIGGLPKHGLIPRAVFLDIPNKLHLHVGLVVAERV